MGKANKVKGELIDSVEMVNLIQTLKDVADNKSFTLLNQKYKFRRFGESFVEFFRMMSLTKVDHLLLKNANPVTGIFVVTIDGSFLGTFNNKILRLALDQRTKYPQFKFMGCGTKSIDRLKPLTPDMKVFDAVQINNIYESAIAIKDYIIGEVMNNRLGKVIVCYAWPKSFEIQQQRAVQLLPCHDLISKQSQFVKEFANVIEESSPKEIITSLTNLWITTRLYEILMDTIIASATAQAAFLEDALDKIKKERDKVRIKFRKTKKSDIDKSLRETFSARMMANANK